MQYHYQLIFLGNTENPLIRDILNVFIKKIGELGLSEKILKIIYSYEFDEKYNNKNPSFCFYIGSEDVHYADVEKIETILTNGDAILPIYFKENNFNNEIPIILHPINGVFAGNRTTCYYVNIALQGLRLLRKTRRVFISYKRSDSTGVAIQLFEELIKNNFDPFLDSYSIPPTEDFQDELYHRMSDSDVVIQLLTPSFHESGYCREEIETSNVKQIGVVQVVWPKCSIEKSDYLCIPVQLEENDLMNIESAEKCKLTLPCLEKLIDVIESCRARNLAARQDTLRGEFIQEAKKVGRLVFQERYYIIERDINKKLLALYLPAIVVPTSYDYYKSREFRELLETPELKVYLLYDSLKVRKDWINHLNWLNSALEVKTIQRNEFDKWMNQK